MPQDTNPPHPKPRGARPRKASAESPLAQSRPYWERKSLAEMSREEWEALCDGCGRCCLVKLEDIDTGQVVFTNVACRLLDCTSCRCRSYETRQEHVSDCVTFSADSILDLDWMPLTCAYRRLANGQGLAWWHPLVSGDPESVHAAGISVRGRVVSELDVEPESLEDYVVDWPDEQDEEITK